MASANKRITLPRTGCILVVASLCLVAIGATQRPAKGRPKRPKRIDVALKVGQMAPDFELYTLERALTMQGKTKGRAASQPATQPAEGKVRLSSFRGKRPVYLIFASYT